MMPIRRAIRLTLVLLAAAGGCRRGGDADAAKRTFTNVREPAVAGAFYPGEQAELSKTVDRCLDAGPAKRVERLRALICPHAGYEYSGSIAGSAYRLLRDEQFKTVVILGPSHTARFAGGFVTRSDGWQTPLGVVPIAPLADDLRKTPPFDTSEWYVVRPQWATVQPRAAKIQPRQDTPDTWEHSLEVQLPFLQKTLKDFAVVPVVIGEINAASAAKALAARLDASTLVVCSTDLSHYNSYDTARSYDSQCIEMIRELNGSGLDETHACGYQPVRTLLELAKLKGWKARPLDVRNSGDTAGDKSRVVGYAAVAFVESGAEPAAGTYSRADRKRLLELARQSLERAAASQSPPQVAATSMPEALREKKGCFTTLTVNGQLRGCIGSLLPEAPLYQAVIDTACKAAVLDHRFYSVKPEEVGGIRIEISVMTVPKELAFSSPDDLLAKLRPHVDGVLLKLPDGRGATYLPQVWEQIPDKTQFLDTLSAKAGAPKNAWRQPGVKVETYQVEAFDELEH